MTNKNNKDMNKYEIITGAIFRSGFIKDKNKVRQQAKESMRNLIASDFVGSLKNIDPNFDEVSFLKACGLTF